MKKFTVFTLIFAITILIPVSAFSKGPKNPLKTPYSKFKRHSGTCYNELVNLEGIAKQFWREVQSYTGPIGRTKQTVEKSSNPEIKLSTLKAQVKKHQGYAADMDELLKSFKKSTKIANKACKAMMKDLNGGVNYFEGKDNLKILKQ